MNLKKLIAGVAGVGLAIALASCGTPEVEETPSPTSTDTPSATDLPQVPDPTNRPNASSDLTEIEVTGAFGVTPVVTVPAPWAVDTTRTQVLVEGDGPIIDPDALIQMHLYGVNARTGETFWETFTEDGSSYGQPYNAYLWKLVPGFVKGIKDFPVGSRILLAIPGPDGYDQSGGRDEADIQIGDTLIFIVDILRTGYTTPTGQKVSVTDPALPTVAGPVEAPEIIIPTTRTAPTELIVQPLVIGEGPAVEAEDVVQIDYAEYIWSTGAMVRQTYGYSPLPGYLGDTIEGWREALVGQTIGSRLLVVVPPDMAYPEGYPKVGIPKGSTMVYVIDISFAADPNSMW